MSERPEKSPKPSSDGPSIARAAKIAAVLFGLILAAVAIAAIMTDGSPHVPFEYGDGLE